MENDNVNADTTDNTNAGSGNESWLDGLSDDLKENEHLKGQDGVESLAKEFVELKSNQPQVPESPDGYEIDIPEGIEADEEAFKGFKGLAHELGLSNDSASKLVGYQAQLNQDFMQNIQDKIKGEVESTEADLKKDWGDDYDKNLETANKAVKHFFADDIGDYLGDSGLGRNKAFVDGMLKVGKMISEHELIAGKLTPPGGPERMDDGSPMLPFNMNKSE